MTLQAHFSQAIQLTLQSPQKLYRYLWIIILVSGATIALHQFIHGNGSMLDLLEHALLIGVCYCLGVILLEHTIFSLFGKFRTFKLSVVRVWQFSLLILILGYLALIPYSHTETFTQLHLQLDLTDPIYSFFKFLPIWVILTALLVQMALTVNPGKDQPNSPKRLMLDSITLESQNGPVKIDMDQIVYIQVVEHYCHIHLHTPMSRKNRLVIHSSLSALDSQLSKDSFVRIHRSYVVNREYIKSIKRHGRDYRLLLSHAENQLPVSRGNIETVYTLLNNYGTCNSRQGH